MLIPAPRESLSRALAALLLTVCACALPACSGVSAPRLEHADATVTERTAEGVALTFTLDAYNDNEIALPLREIDYALELNGRTVFRGTRSAEATLRRRGVQQVRLPAVLVPGPDAPSGTADFRLTGTITYVTPGRLAEVLFDSGVRRPSVSFETSGQVDLGTP